ncbi:MAG: hypothetical protein V2I57_03785 [Xanthomonadales bacterium]|jgi:hypothetical protein|nr:hypothetical protein [Xanthomonadales bacterium]
MTKHPLKPWTVEPGHTHRPSAPLRFGTAIACLFGCTPLATFHPAFAQTTEPATGPEPLEREASDTEDPSQETDISEDNYRRFMELDDRRLDRPAFAPGGVQPANSLQKLGALPESSQKHLRNQLRGIILSRGAWTPGERDEGYAFVPSAEARARAQRGDAQLLQQEAEAWAELVNEYHEREAAFFAGTSGQPGEPRESGEPGAPARPGQPAPEGSGQPASAETQTGRQAGNSQGTAGKGGQEGRDGAQGQAGSDGGTDRQGGAASESQPPPERPEIPDWVAEDDAARTPAPPSNEGVEQSASDYLQARGLADGEPVDIEAIRIGDPEESADTADAERDLRWGEDAQTLLPELGSAAGRTGERAPSGPATEPSEHAPPANSLTREELLKVRGVTAETSPPADVFTDFTPGATPIPRDPLPDEDETPPEAGADQPQAAPDGEDG